MTGQQLEMQASNMRVAAFTGGRDVPSARFRVEQYAYPLRSNGIELDVFASAAGTYPPRRRAARPLWLVRAVAERVPSVLASREYDLTLLQRELVSTLSTLERFTGRPRVLDVDDAIWLHRGGGFVRRIVRHCDAVICGNAFLAEYFSRLHPHVHQLPTAVDTDRFTPGVHHAIAGEIIVGWSGTSGGYKYFAPVLAAMAELFRRYPGVRLRVVSDIAPDFSSLDPKRVEFVRWSPETEVSSIQEFDIGIMPLADSEWARGKCSYKMLLYMSCGISSVVSPVGMNRDVLALGSAALSARTTDEWISRLAALIEDPTRRAHIGREARCLVEQHYSVGVVAPRMATLLRSIRG